MSADIATMHLKIMECPQQIIRRCIITACSLMVAKQVLAWKASFLTGRWPDQRDQQNFTAEPSSGPGHRTGKCPDIVRNQWIRISKRQPSVLKLVNKQKDCYQ
jgi:hypothetical protein